MRAGAPGKVVISGAYAVLEGAPAVVSAVSRYAWADARRTADFVTPEVKAALGDGPAPWFDASALRGPRGKLGLGSSAAILVASLASLALEHGELADDALADSVLERALAAHRAAQRGGSGIDVAASVRGGSLIGQARGERLELSRVAIPSALHVEIWSGGSPASTPELRAKVDALRDQGEGRYRELVQELSRHAERAAEALRAGATREFLRALDAQRQGLTRLGEAAGAPIVTREVAELGERALREDAVVLPSGAGGGDVALFLGLRPPTAELAKLRERLDHERIEASLGARGVHAAPTPS